MSNDKPIQLRPARLVVHWDASDVPAEERLSEVLRRALDISGLNEERLSETTGIPVTNITNVLRMQVPFSLDEIQRISKVTGYDVGAMFRANQAFIRSIFAPEVELKRFGEPSVQVRSVTDDGRLIQELVRFENFASRAVIALRQISDEARDHIDRLKQIMTDYGLSEPSSHEVTCFGCNRTISRVDEEVTVYCSEGGGEFLYRPRRCKDLGPGETCPNGNKVRGNSHG